MSDRPKVLHISASWKTPASAYPEKEHGTARIKRVHYKKGGMYHMNYVRGFDYLLCKGRIPVTNLQLLEKGRWKTWMTDDPSHWLALCDFMHRAVPSRLLCGGLGLGLMIQAIAELRKDEIQEIVVVEMNPDVIELVAPLLPLQDKTTIVCADFFEFVKDRQPFDTVLVDLWAGEPKKLLADFEAKREWVETFYPYPETLTLYLGFQAMIDKRRESYKTAIHMASTFQELNRRIGRGDLDF